ncbi:uncharacterized protein LOC135388107 isoform X1 [Ornithodoros turicata]|uniref:uncharacterized protein LOC135388107 isoform X1 n=1 Tax=Ornithodoros turicata TaxID=34597 RepID=UPI0031391BA2
MAEHWSVQQVQRWLAQNGLAEFAGRFEDEDIDGETLINLSERMVERLLPNARLQVKLLKLIGTLTTDAREQIHDAPTVPEVHPSPGPETQSEDGWPDVYRLPGFPPDLAKKLQLKSNEFLSPKRNEARTTLVQCLALDIISKTPTPSRSQLSSVMNALKASYPFLVDSTGSCDAIKLSLINKLKKERQAMEDHPQVAENRQKFGRGGGRKRIDSQGEQDTPCGFQKMKSYPERREGSKRAVPSSWKHFKRMESLLGARAALRELDDSQDTAGDEGTEDSETDRSFVIAPLEGMYADSQEEYIVPTTTDPSMPSTSGTSSADATSLRLSEVRSLADPPSSAQELLSIQIKEEVTDEQMEQESFQQPSRSPPTATVTSTPLVTFPEAISESAPILPPHPVFSTSEPAHLPSLTEPEAQPAIAAPSLDATRPPLEQTTTTGGFNRSRKRPATPWITLSATERKAKVELEILFAQRRKIEAELRKFEADERKVVAETLLLAEEMKRCEEEKKKFKAEAEFFLQEKAKSEEETKKAAAKAALLLEHKNFYVEQQKTEMVRRRMLLLEMRKMKHDLKLLQ